jgi:hypothetical protein
MAHTGTVSSIYHVDPAFVSTNASTDASFVQIVITGAADNGTQDRDHDAASAALPLPSAAAVSLDCIAAGAPAAGGGAPLDPPDETAAAEAAQRHVDDLLQRCRDGELMIDDAITEAVAAGSLRALRELNLARIEGPVARLVALCPRLAKLSLAHCDLPDEEVLAVVAALPRLPRLVHLDMADTVREDAAAALAAALEGMPQLQRFVVRPRSTCIVEQFPELPNHCIFPDCPQYVGRRRYGATVPSASQCAGPAGAAPCGMHV